MINEQGEILNKAGDLEGNQARDLEGNQAGDQVLNQVQDQDKDQFTSSRVAGRDVSMGAIEIDSSTSGTQQILSPVNLFPEYSDPSIQTLQQPNSSSTAENSQLTTRGSDQQNNDQQENDGKKKDQLKRYRDLSIVGVLFSTLGLIAGVAMTATQFPAGMISAVAVPFLIAVPAGLLTLSLRILFLTNKNYQQQLLKCQANQQVNQQANQQNNARSPDIERPNQDDLSAGLLSNSGQLTTPSPRPSSPELQARPLTMQSSRG